MAWQGSEIDFHNKVLQFNFNWIYGQKKGSNHLTPRNFVEKIACWTRWTKLIEKISIQLFFFFSIFFKCSFTSQIQYWQFCIRLSFEFLLIARKAKKNEKKERKSKYSKWNIVIEYVMKCLRCRWSDFKIEIKSSIVISMQKGSDKKQPIYLKFGLKWKIWKIEDTRDIYCTVFGKCVQNSCINMYSRDFF